MNPLSILCVTKAEPAVWPILEQLHSDAQWLGTKLVLVADGKEAERALLELELAVAGVVESAGYIESVLDQALAYTQTPYVLRLDDDELPSRYMKHWLDALEYGEAELWSFPRVHLWQDRETALVTSQLWPDHQTRLATRGKAGGRYAIHCGSPYGLGAIAPVAIEHHKFL